MDSSTEEANSSEPGSPASSHTVKRDVVKRARKASKRNIERITSLEGTTVIFTPLERESNLAKLNHLKLSQFLTSELPGRIKEIRPNHARNIIAVDVVAPAAKLALLQLNRICSIPVRAYEPRPFNSCYGVLLGVDTSISDSQIMEAIKSDPPLIAARRIRRDAGAVRLTFLGPKPPKRVSFHLLTMQVREYLPRTVQCNNCLRYGHVAACCSRRKICPNCGSSHESPMCPESEPTCINCKGRHVATSRDCPSLKLQRHIARERSRSNSSYREAKAKLRLTKRRNQPKAMGTRKSQEKLSHRGVQPAPKSLQTSQQQIVWAETDFPPLGPVDHPEDKDASPAQPHGKKSDPPLPLHSQPAYRKVLDRPEGADLPMVIIQLLFAALKAIVSAVPECTALAEIQSVLQLEAVIAPLLLPSSRR
ncbi:uncharacterized protein LOC135397483 [Ornithodoros turicata]|uniref:uncharacterized protein LOC135397483 n=1 Tax=Ornithodoros turicata TaxID=34597 RepID=UPI003138F623